MATTITSTNRILTTQRDSELARSVLHELEGSDGQLLVQRAGAPSTPLPQDLGRLLQDILTAVRSGATITIGSMPEQLTTSAAAAILGVSRPTLMKLISDGVLPATKVGSHTRLKQSDVLQAREERRARERAAFESLRALLDD